MRGLRRDFLQTVAVAGASWARSATARAADANGKLRVASVGTGGQGKHDLLQVATSDRVEVVALCNIDQSADHWGWAVERFPKAAHFADWRRLMDAAGTFDAVIVSTPDHMHAPIALPAMGLGKHVYCEKPLTHTVFEARQMALAARRGNVVTQMGNQIQSHRAYLRAVQLVHAGAIGRVSEVRAWQSGKLSWLLESHRPAGADPVPPHVKWDD